MAKTTNITLEFVGTSPLLCHNAQLADPDNDICREIAKINAKRKKTEEDRADREKLEWIGGLYIPEGADRPVLPTQNIRKCLINAAKITRAGKSVERALYFADMWVPIAYEGPRDPEALYKATGAKNRSLVVVQRNRLVRVRPQFSEWAVVAKATLLENVLSLDDLRDIVESAGLMEGIGDGRSIGYGRFRGALKV